MWNDIYFIYISNNNSEREEEKIVIFLIYTISFMSSTIAPLGPISTDYWLYSLPRTTFTSFTLLLIFLFFCRAVSPYFLSKHAWKMLTLPIFRNNTIKRIFSLFCLKHGRKILQYWQRDLPTVRKHLNIFSYFFLLEINLKGSYLESRKSVVVFRNHHQILDSTTALPW
jgi:hypothetical protein